MHRRPNYLADGESLQTDVMRFMAIIAFCLIAILALVRNVEPPLPTVEKPDPDSAPQATAQAGPVTPAPAAQHTQDTPPTPANPHTPARPPEPVAVAVPRDATAPPADRPVQSTEPVQPSPAAAQSPARRGLSLRFASDRDFLNLVASGTIGVFAFRPSEVLGLGQDFRFRASESPGEVYELLPDTIPSTIVAALQGASADARTYTWAVRIPPVMGTAIRRFVEQQAHGELVIDRHGEVRHVAG